MTEKLHDAFRVSMGGKAHVVHLHLDMDNFIIDCNFLLATEDLVSNSSWHAVTWNDDCVLFVTRPLFECLQTQASVKHTWRGEEHHWSV